MVIMGSHVSSRILFSRQEIAEIVKRPAFEISWDYQGRNPLLIGILKGSFMFMTDLGWSMSTSSG